VWLRDPEKARVGATLAVGRSYTQHCLCLCVARAVVRVVNISLASTHTALVSSPSLAVLHLST